MKPQYIEIDKDGNKCYFSDKEMTVLHRDDGPAIEWKNGGKTWMRNGWLHREDGPAIEWPNTDKDWYIDGVCFTESEFKARKAPCNGKKVTIDGIEYVLIIN